jgi:putative FmdB family regulatory protein
MPIYEYACDRCESEFEAEQRITDEPLKSCPQCRSRKVKRLISQTSFVLKGSGWYSDLYSSENGKDAKAAEKEAPERDKDAAPKQTSKKTDEKSESKSKSKGKGKGAKAAA